MMTFFLGTHEVPWLGKYDHAPLFVSHRRLYRRKTLPVARRAWALDSGGFSELSLFGAWKTTAQEYANAVRRYQDEIGKLGWASSQDWMCEPWITKKTGLTVEEHQRRSVASVLELRAMAPEVNWLPVLQGWTIHDYFACVREYERAGVRLEREPLVGVGSVCRRQGTKEAVEIIEELATAGLSLHGFGFKKKGLEQLGHALKSADSMAWSFSARKNPVYPGCTHKTCSNCPKYAFRWYDKVLKKIGGAHGEGTRVVQRRFRFDGGPVLGEARVR